MGYSEETVNLLDEVIGRLENEIRNLSETRKETQRQQRVTKRLLEAIMHASEVEKNGGLSVTSTSRLRRTWTAWNEGCDPELRQLLQRPEARKRWSQLNAHEPPLTCGKMIAELKKL